MYREVIADRGPSSAGVRCRSDHSCRANRSLSALIVEQEVHEALKIADRVYVLRMGAVSFAGPAAELQDDKRLKDVYL